MALRQKANGAFLKKVMKTLPALQAEEVAEVLESKKAKPSKKAAKKIFKNLFLRPPKKKEIKQILDRTD